MILRSPRTKSSHRHASTLPAVVCLFAVCLLAGSTQADWVQTYELEGFFTVITPVGSDSYPLIAADETPEWSSGLLTDDATPPNTNSTVSLNGGAAVPAAEGVVQYTSSPQLTTNSITIRFANGDSSGLTSVGDGEITIEDLNFYYLTRTNPAFDSIIVVYGPNDTDVAGGIGSMAGGVVSSWSQDSTGVIHAEVMCHLQCQLGGLTAGELIIAHDETATFAIDLTDEYPATDDVPASVGMTFTNGYQNIAFESAGPEAGGGGQRARTHLTGVAIPMPEPGVGLASLCSVATLAILRRRSRSH